MCALPEHLRHDLVQRLDVDARCLEFCRVQQHHDTELASVEIDVVGLVELELYAIELGRCCFGWIGCVHVSSPVNKCSFDELFERRRALLRDDRVSKSSETSSA